MKEKLFSRSYLFIVIANFLLYYGFWLLMPILPFYLKDVFATGKDVSGVVISCYTISALCVIPVTGYLLDSCKRKPIYLAAYLLFAGLFAGYLMAGTLLLLMLLRGVHGMAFGTVTASGNTLVIDLTPASRRGEALGYYGLANNLAMALGPMAGLLLYDHGYSYPLIFGSALLSTFFGFGLACSIKTPAIQLRGGTKPSWDKFILRKGIPAGIALLLLSIPYGMTTNYIAMYAKECGIGGETGLYFSVMAFGMATSRMISGRWVDKGYLTDIIKWGFIGVLFCFGGLAALKSVEEWDPTAGMVLFYTLPLVMGVSFGVMFPAYNTLFANLAPPEQRGTATSTYLTSWDLGLGLGVLVGGFIAEKQGFSTAYLFGTALATVSMFYFNRKVIPHYEQNKIQEIPAR